MNTNLAMLIIQRRIGYVKPANRLVATHLTTKVTEEDRKNHKELTNSCRMEFQQCYDELYWDVNRFNTRYQCMRTGYPIPNQVRKTVKNMLAEVELGTRIQVGMIEKNEDWDTGALFGEFAYIMMVKNDYEGKIL
jgi:hypothetical protein